MLNKQKGNMYGIVTHTWNPIKGKCSHNCKYCYMKVWKQKPIRLVEKELKDNLGNGNFIFVGSSTDMFADDVPNEWINKVIMHCRDTKFSKTRFLFQTKNPKKMMQSKFMDIFPSFSYFGITLETNRDTNDICKAMNPVERFQWFVSEIPAYFEKFVTIEPIMDFDLEPLILWLRNIKPKFVFIGADSKGHNLPEPSKEKIEALIKELKKFTEVRLKPNLKRIYTKKEE